VQGYSQGFRTDTPVIHLEIYSSNSALPLIFY
jgi:hypothetical protein